MNAVNASYRVAQAWPPMVYKKSTSIEPFHVVGTSLVRNMNEDFKVYKRQIKAEIKSWPETTLLGVFPEFCWRKTSPEEVFAFINKLKMKVRSDLALVLGTLEFTLNGEYTNNAIVLYDGRLWYVPKTKVLERDRELGLIDGENPGVISLPRFDLAVLVCADLWEASLCTRLATKGGAEIFAVPAWTATRKGNRDNAQRDWIALARTMSTMFDVCVVVGDHKDNFEKTDVANATVVFKPEDRMKELPSGIIDRDITLINPEDFRAVVAARKRKGLSQIEIKDEKAASLSN